MSEPNAARDLAGTGTAGTWRSAVWQERQLTTLRDVRDDTWLADVRLDADAAKIVRAVNALPALGDLLDILAAHRDRHCDTCGPKPEPTCVVCRMAWPCGTSIARDAVEVALREES